MNKRIVIKIGPGTLADGYTAAVQIGSEGAPPQVEAQATLPSAEDLKRIYREWQRAYWQMGLPARLEPIAGETNFSDISRLEVCRQQSRQLRDRVREWLNSSDFRPIREKVLEQLSPTDTARILLQTSDPFLQRIPWYELEFFQRYRNTEVGICPVDYQQVYYSISRSEKVRILAVLGDCTGLDTTIDKTLLANLDGADIHFLESPSRQTFTQALWDKQGWDILFFAGHSNSSSSYFQSTEEEKRECSGELWLNPDEKLTIPQLRHALRKAIDRGLNTAIFNSCDGLGLAADLADLHIPQVLVMREPVPDQVAHTFLQGFLEAFSDGTPFYTAVRDAREKLQGLESRFPCATWLPVIVQNLAETPPTWQSLQGAVDSRESTPAVSAVSLPTPSTAGPSTATLPTAESPTDESPTDESPTAKSSTVRSKLPTSVPRTKSRNLLSRLKVGIGCGLVVSSVVIVGRLLGLLEPLEVGGYDYSLRARPPELADSRILIVTNTTEDIASFPNPTGKSSFSDDTLLKVLDKLTAARPAVIGLDIYHGHTEKTPQLKEKIRDTKNLIAICKEPFRTDNGTLVTQPPPPEIKDTSRIGANDFVALKSGGEVLRRHLLRLSQASNSPCPGTPSESDGTFVDTFSLVVALAYIEIRELEAKPVKAFNPFLITKNFGGYRNTDQNGSQLLLNYRITADPGQTNCGRVKETPAECLTVSELLARDPARLAEFVEGKVVLIGTTDMDYAASDRWRTPYTRASYLDDESKVPGVFLHAQMISQFLSFHFDNRALIGTWNEQQEIAWIITWALLGGLTGACARQKLPALLYLLLSAGLLLIVSWHWFERDAVWTPWVPAAIALPTAALSAHAVTSKRKSAN